MKMVFNIQFNKVAFRLFKVADCSIFRIFFFNMADSAASSHNYFVRGSHDPIVLLLGNWGFPMHLRHGIADPIAE